MREGCAVLPVVRHRSGDRGILAGLLFRCVAVAAAGVGGWGARAVLAAAELCWGFVGQGKLYRGCMSPFPSRVTIARLVLTREGLECQTLHGVPRRATCGACRCGPAQSENAFQGGDGGPGSRRRRIPLALWREVSACLRGVSLALMGYTSCEGGGARCDQTRPAPSVFSHHQEGA